MAHATVTVELMGGPADGFTLPYLRPPGARMPDQLPDPEDPRLPSIDGYHLQSLDTRTMPEVWRYEWLHTHTHTGHRRGCSRQNCGKRCPSRQLRRGGTT